jgi:hypothetical protein
MVVWRVVGSEIGPNDCGAVYFATKREADARRLEYMKGIEGIYEVDFPERIVIKNRKQLAEALNDAMGYGGS